MIPSQGETTYHVDVVRWTFWLTMNSSFSTWGGPVVGRSDYLEWVMFRSKGKTRSEKWKFAYIHTHTFEYGYQFCTKLERLFILEKKKAVTNFPSFVHIRAGKYLLYCSADPTETFRLLAPVEKQKRGKNFPFFLNTKLKHSSRPVMDQIFL